MSKVKYIIEVDKDDIDVFLNHMNEHYIIHQYDGEIAVCGRVLLSTFRTATPLTESNGVVIGHWIPLGNYDDWGNENSYKCSECGEVSDYPDNYCRECGTKMESEKTE